MGAECSKLRQPMHAILALSRAQLLLIVVTRSRDLSRECHVTKHKTPARSNFPMSDFENSGTIQFSSSRSTSRGLCPKNVEKRAHPIVKSDVAGSIPGVSHIFRIVWIIIPACLIKQPNGTLSRMYVQTYISVK